MFYYLYQITNAINGKIYIGVHQTASLEDGYMGSGKHLLAAMKKYGIENFSKTILEHFQTPKDMFEREKQIVNDEFLARIDTYNLRCGGHGGFDHINNSMTIEEWSLRGKKGAESQLKKNQLGFQKCPQPGFKSAGQQRNAIEAARSPECKAKIKEIYRQNGHCKGEKNPNFGNRWICHPEFGAKKCKVAELEDLLSTGWIRGKKIR